MLVTAEGYCVGVCGCAFILIFMPATPYVRKTARAVTPSLHVELPHILVAP